MTRRLRLFGLAIAILSDALRGSVAQVIVSGEPKALAIYAPRPHYPHIARQAGITGRGVAILSVDPRTGIVKGGAYGTDYGG
jgi:hypothetical protein